LQCGQAPSKQLQDGEPTPLSIQTGDNPASARVRARDFSAKYRDLPNQGLLEVGLVFDRQARDLVRADCVKLGESRG
jgi:hypothetical protein